MSTPAACIRKLLGAGALPASVAAACRDPR
ncbi:MAG: Vmc-like lipoprotein signal peptide domain-containing protein [Xanthobacteraceae bacterium]